MKAIVYDVIIKLTTRGICVSYTLEKENEKSMNKQVMISQRTNRTPNGLKPHKKQ